MEAGGFGILGWMFSNVSVQLWRFMLHVRIREYLKSGNQRSWPAGWLVGWLLGGRDKPRGRGRWVWGVGG